jgi:hypothetical protein
LALRAGVIVAVALKQVNDTPYSQAGSNGDNKGGKRCYIVNDIDKRKG